MNPAVLDQVERAMTRLHNDMLERARHGIDVIHGEEYRVVNAGNGAWVGFCEALSALRAARKEE